VQLTVLKLFAWNETAVRHCASIALRSRTCDLDEPTNGLDPQGMKEVRGLIVHLSREQKKTIILSSHLLNEIEIVANRMVIINDGELVVQGDVSKLLDEGRSMCDSGSTAEEGLRPFYSGSKILSENTR